MSDGITVAAVLKSDKLDKIAADLRPRASEIVRKTAADIEARAKTTVPVDTGNLKNSIQTEMEPDSTEAIVGTAVNYSVYVEYGTRRMAAKPYMTPAAEAARPAFEAAMKTLIE